MASASSLRPYGGTDAVLAMLDPTVGTFTGAVHEATAPAGRTASAEGLRELSFRACRDGLDARLRLDDGLRPAREVAYRAIALAGAYAAELGCWDELMLLHRLLEEGNGAQRQRRHEREGGMRLLLRRLADETVPYADNTTTREVQNMTIHRHGRFDRGAATGAAA